MLSGASSAAEPVAADICSHHRSRRFRFDVVTTHGTGRNEVVHVQMIEAHLAQLGHDVEAFMWALSVCHSRCFRFEQGGVQHIMVPGVDMANHTCTLPRP